MDPPPSVLRVIVSQLSLLSVPDLFLLIHTFTAAIQPRVCVPYFTSPIEESDPIEEFDHD